MDNIESIFISASPYKKIHKEMLTPTPKKTLKEYNNQSDNPKQLNNNPFIFDRTFESKNL